MSTTLISVKVFCFLLFLLQRSGAHGNATPHEVPQVVLPLDATSFEFNGSIWHFVDPNCEKLTCHKLIYGSGNKKLNIGVRSLTSNILHSEGTTGKRWNSRSSHDGKELSSWRNTKIGPRLRKRSDIPDVEEPADADLSTHRPKPSRPSTLPRPWTNQVMSIQQNEGQEEGKRNPWDNIMPPVDDFTVDYLRLQGPEMSYYRAIEGTNTAQAHPKFFKWLRADDSYDMPVWNMMIEHLIPVMMRVYFTEWVHFILHGAVIYAMTRDLIARSNASGDTVMRPLDDVWSALLEGGTALRDLLGNAQLNGFRCDPRIARLKDDLILEATARWSRQSGPGDVFRARFNVDIEKSSEGAKDDIVGADSSDAADSGPDTQARNAERTPSSGTHDTVGVSISEDGDDPAVASRGHLFSEHFDWTRMTRDEAIAVRALLQDLGAKFHNMIDEALRLVDGLDTEVAPVGGALQSCEYGFEVAQYGLNVAINTPTTRWKEPAERDFILRDQQGLRRQQDPTIEAEDEDVNIEDDDDDDDDGEPLLKRPRLNVEGSKNRA